MEQRTRHRAYLKKNQFKLTGYGRPLGKLVMVQSFKNGKLLSRTV